MFSHGKLPIIHGPATLHDCFWYCAYLSHNSEMHFPKKMTWWAWRPVKSGLSGIRFWRKQVGACRIIVCSSVCDERAKWKRCEETGVTLFPVCSQWSSFYACVIFLSKEETLVEVLFSQTSCIQFWWTLVCDLSHTVLRWLDLDPGVERSFLGLCWLWCWPHPTYLEGQGMMGIQVDLLWWFRVTLLQLFCTQIKKCFSWLQEVLLSLDNSFTDICNWWSEGKMLFFWQQGRPARALLMPLWVRP